MPIVSSFPPGTPVWVDLQTADPAAAGAFYRELFGWDVAPPGSGPGGYAPATLRDVPVTAIGPLPPGLDRPVWTAYFAVADLDAAAAAVETAGGTVLLPPGEVSPDIRLAIVADPLGAVLGLWQPAPDMRWLRDEPGAVDWVELAADGYEAAFPFYEAVLGVGASEMLVGGEPYGLLDAGDSSVAGATGAGPGIPPHWLVYFTVADLDAAVARLTGAGGTLLAPPLSAPGVGRWAEVADPQGAAFGLLEPEPEPV